MHPSNRGERININRKRQDASFKTREGKTIIIEAKCNLEIFDPNKGQYVDADTYMPDWVGQHNASL